MSAIVTSNGLGTAAVAGTILSGYTIGGMCGIGFACFVPALMMRVREKLPEEAISPAAGFASASHKTGAFLSAYYVGIVGKITGSDNPKMSILVAMIVIVVLAIPWIISIVRDKEAK